MTITLPEIRKDGPTQSGVHVDAVSGAIRPFRVTGLAKPKCERCGVKHAKGVPCFEKAFDPDKHPRGQPENAGEFGPGGSASPKRVPTGDSDSDALGRWAGTGNVGTPKFDPSHVEQMPVEQVKKLVQSSSRDKWDNIRSDPKLLDSMKSEGFDPSEPITLLKSPSSNGGAFVYDGNHRLKAADELGLSTVPVVGRIKGQSVKPSEMGLTPEEKPFSPLPRSQMPQLGGPPTPNTPSASLPVNVRGNVDLSDQFLADLKAKGVAVKDSTMDPRTLKPSQAEINPVTVDALTDKMASGTFDETPKPLWISKDNYVIDGHHRWAADIQRGQKSIAVRQIDLPIQQALDASRTFAASMGLKQESVSESKAGPGQKPQAPTDTMIDQANKTGGFSINPKTGAAPTGGFMVAIQGHNVDLPGITDLKDPGQRSKVKAAILGFVKQNKDIFSKNPHAYVGGWLDKDSGTFTLDPSENIIDKDEAVTLGQQRNQLAIWSVVDGTEVDTGGTGDRDVAKARLLTATGGWLGRGARQLGGVVPRRSSGDTGLTTRLLGTRFGKAALPHQGPADIPATPLLGVLKAGAWDPTKHPRGEPGNAGEFGPGGSSSSSSIASPSQKPKTKPQGIFLPLIAPHLSDTRTLGPRKGETESREVKNTPNPTATKFDTLPAEFQAKILAQVKRESPNQLTPAKMDANLEDVFEHAAADPVAQAGMHWYNDANDDAQKLSTSSNISLPHAIGMIAAMSPQTDWDSNIAMAQFSADKLTADEPVNLPASEIAYRANQSKASKGDAHDVTIPNRKRLSEMSPGQAAWALYAMASTEELKNGLTALTGKPKKAQLSMGAQNVAKAIRIYRGEEPDTILSGHKVRSFYNNISDPDNAQGHDDVTVDTHAVSAAAGYRITASGRTIKKMFEGTASTPSNVKGAYSLFADAYRRLAVKHGITPNQAQAIVWTHWQTVKGGHQGYREDHPNIPNDVPPKSAKVRAKEIETKARAAARSKKKAVG